MPIAISFVQLAIGPLQLAIGTVELANGTLQLAKGKRETSEPTGPFAKGQCPEAEGTEQMAKGGAEFACRTPSFASWRSPFAKERGHFAKGTVALASSPVGSGVWTALFAIFPRHFKPFPLLDDRTVRGLPAAASLPPKRGVPGARGERPRAAARELHARGSDGDDRAVHPQGRREVPRLAEQLCAGDCAEPLRSRSLARGGNDAPGRGRSPCSIKASGGIDDAQKIALGIFPRRCGQSPIPRPRAAPALTIDHLSPGRHRLRYHDPAHPSCYAKPINVVQLELRIAVGRDPARSWRDAGRHHTATRHVFSVSFGAQDTGQTATYFGRWITQRGLAGPWSPGLAVTIV